MDTIVEIDKAGRIVVPKKFRDALHLTPGTKIKVERSGDTLVFEPDIAKAKLVIENGVPLIFSANSLDAPTISTELVNEFIAQGRLERERRFLCLDPEPDDAEQSEAGATA